MIREEDRRFKNLEFKIGAFLAASLAGVLLVFIFYGLQKDFFVATYGLNFTVERGTGFSKGMPVKLSGFRIGRVTSIALNDQAMVDIAIEIDKKYSGWIRSDSVAKLVKEGLVGDNIVEISVGSRDKAELKDGAAIVYVKTKGLDEVADEIAEKVKPVLVEVRDIIGYINDPEGDLKKTIRNLEELSSKLEGTRQRADLLLVSTNQSIGQVSAKANSLLDATGRKVESLDLAPTLNRVNQAVDAIDKKLPPLLDKADAALVDLSRVSRETRILSESAFPKIPGLLSQAEDVMLGTDKLIGSIQNVCLLRGNAPAAGDKLFIRGDSHD